MLNLGDRCFQGLLLDKYQHSAILNSAVGPAEVLAILVFWFDPLLLLVAYVGTTCPSAATTGIGK